MLDRFVLKNKADCTSQCLKRSFGARVMTFFVITILFAYNGSFWSYLSLGIMLDRFVLKNNADCTSQRLKRTSGARVMIVSCLALRRL